MDALCSTLCIPLPSCSCPSKTSTNEDETANDVDANTDPTNNDDRLQVDVPPALPDAPHNDRNYDRILAMFFLTSLPYDLSIIFNVVDPTLQVRTIEDYIQYASAVAKRAASKGEGRSDTRCGDIYVDSNPVHAYDLELPELKAFVPGAYWDQWWVKAVVPTEAVVVEGVRARQGRAQEVEPVQRGDVPERLQLGGVD